MMILLSMKRGVEMDPFGSWAVSRTSGVGYCFCWLGPQTSLLGVSFLWLIRVSLPSMPTKHARSGEMLEVVAVR